MVAPLVAASLISGAGSLLGGLFGASSAKKQAKQAAAQFAEQMAYTKQRDAQNDAFAEKIFGMVPDMLNRTYAQEDYYKDFNQQQQDAALELMNYLRGWDVQNYQDRTQDYNMTMARQTLQDDAAAEQRRYELERIARNQGLAQDERQWAISQLDRERGIRADERNQETAQINDYKDVRAQEYNDRYARLMEDRVTRAGERQYEQNKQDMIIAQASKMRDGVQRVLAEQGTLRAPELLGPEDIAAEATKRGKTYTDIMDKLSERQMSQLEASLIKRGMQTGADSGEQRSEMIARLAPEYQKALLTAENEAASVVEGKNKTLTDRFNALRVSRESALNEAQLAEGAGLDMVTRLGELNSGILDRDLGSAAELIRNAISNTGVAGPVSIGSGIYDQGNPSAGLSAFLGTPSRAINPTTQGMGYDIQNLPSYDWSGLIGNAVGMRTGSGAGAQAALNIADRNNQMAQENLGAAKKGLAQGINDIAGMGLSWLGGQKDWSFMNSKIPSSPGSFASSAFTPSFSAPASYRGITPFNSSLDW